LGRLRRASAAVCVPETCARSAGSPQPRPGADMSASATFDGDHPPSSALIAACVHCGFCLPTCPTYALWGGEMDSPRGRLYLMKAGLEGRTAMVPALVAHLDDCLGCMACVTACPSGVQYAPLIEATRGQIERRFERSAGDSLFRRLLMTIVPYPWRMRLAMVPLLVLGPLVRRLGVKAAQPATAPPTGRPRDTDGSFVARVRAALALAPPVSWRSIFGRLPARTPAVDVERQ